MKIGVFWIPPNPLSDIVWEQKIRCRDVYPDAAYINHPVHATLFVIEAVQASAVKQKLSELSFEIPPAVTYPCGWRVFYRDPATGGDTVALEIERSESLVALQQRIAEALAPLRVEMNSRSRVPWTGQFLESLQEYGFPFVGEHWIPHLTVASVPAGSTFCHCDRLPKVPPVELSVDTVSLWHIGNDETHTLVKEIKLGGAG